MSGMQSGLRLMMRILPLLVFSFIVAGMIQTLVSLTSSQIGLAQNRGCGGYSLVQQLVPFCMGGRML